MMESPQGPASPRWLGFLSGVAAKERKALRQGSPSAGLFVSLVNRYDLRRSEAHLEATIACIISRSTDSIPTIEKYTKDEQADELFLLGMMYEEGIFFQKNEEKAVELYSQAMNINGHPISTNLLGLMCQEGKGNMRVDCAKAIEYYRKAAEMGSLAGISNIGVMYSNGEGVPKDPVKACEYFRTAAERGYLLGQYNLASMYEEGLGVKQDRKDAFRLYVDAAHKGHGPSMLRVAQLYKDGIGVEVDLPKAFEYAELAAQDKEPAALNFLAMLYQNGTGVPQDEVRAFQIYGEAAAFGDAAAQCNLGYLYERGLGVQQDLQRAFHCYSMAAKEDATAQNNLGWMYENGMSVDKDELKAEELYTRAALSGNGHAQCNLGWLWERRRAFRQACQYYAMAERSGNMQGIFNIGFMYENGDGVVEDHAKAIQYFMRAAAQGHVRAIERVADYIAQAQLSDNIPIDDDEDDEEESESDDAGTGAPAGIARMDEET